MPIGDVGVLGQFGSRPPAVVEPGTPFPSGVGDDVTMEGRAPLLPAVDVLLRPAMVVGAVGKLVGRESAVECRGVWASGVKSASRNCVRTSFKALTHAWQAFVSSACR